MVRVRTAGRLAGRAAVMAARTVAGCGGRNRGVEGKKCLCLTEARDERVTRVSTCGRVKCWMAVGNSESERTR